MLTVFDATTTCLSVLAFVLVMAALFRWLEVTRENEQKGD